MLHTLAVSSWAFVSTACRLADFGLSRLMDNDQSHISTQTFGTIPYMPPELLADGRMTRAVDVYSFGIISAFLTFIRGAGA